MRSSSAKNRAGFPPGKKKWAEKKGGGLAVSGKHTISGIFPCGKCASFLPQRSRRRSGEEPVSPSSLGFTVFSMWGLISALYQSGMLFLGLPEKGDVWRYGLQKKICG